MAKIFIGDKPLNLTINDTHPIGSVIMWPSDTLPSSEYLWARGGTASITEWPELYTKYGITFGGDGITTFGLPDMQGVVPVGKKSTDADFDTLGESHGNKTVTLAQANLPNLALPLRTVSGFQISTDTGSDNTVLRIAYDAMTAGAPGSNGQLRVLTGGSGTPINNLQPYRVINWIIKGKNSVPIGATVKDSLGTSATDALSQNQGYQLDQRFNNYLPLTGGSLSGNLLTPSHPYVWVRLGTVFNTTPGGWYQVTNFTNKISDTLNCWNTSTNRFTAPVSGRYLVIWGGWIASGGTTERYALGVRKNGSVTQFGGGNLSANDTPAMFFSNILNLTAGDYLECWAYTAVSMAFSANNSDHSFFFQTTLLG